MQIWTTKRLHDREDSFNAPDDRRLDYNNAVHSLLVVICEAISLRRTMSMMDVCTNLQFHSTTDAPAEAHITCNINIQLSLSDTTCICTYLSSEISARSMPQCITPLHMSAGDTRTYLLPLSSDHTHLHSNLPQSTYHSLFLFDIFTHYRLLLCSFEDFHVNLSPVSSLLLSPQASKRR